MLKDLCLTLGNHCPSEQQTLCPGETDELALHKAASDVQVPPQRLEWLAGHSRLSAELGPGFEFQLCHRSFSGDPEPVAISQDCCENKAWGEGENNAKNCVGSRSGKKNNTEHK